MNLAENLKEVLINDFRGKPVSGGKDIVVKCKYCNDKSGHMYVLLPTKDHPAIFHCVRCDASGLLTSSKLLEWGVNNPEVLVELASMNKKSLSLTQNRKYKDRDVYYLKNDYIRDDPLSEAKLRFINYRLGYTLTYQDLIDNKIVLNLYDLIESNKITKLTRYPNICDELDQSFMGFISVDNAYINMRNLRKGKIGIKSLEKRYINYNIFEKFDNTEKFYVCPTTIDIRNPDPIHLRIAEGPFDILSIKYNLMNGENTNNIYAAILGSSYYSIVRYFIVKLGITNLIVDIYKDSDVLESYFYDMSDILSSYNIPIYLHENIKQGKDLFGKDIKDFGVPKDLIEEKIIRV